MDIGVPELLIILVIVVVLFGPGRFGKALGELGKGIRSFKDGLEDPDQKAAEAAATSTVEASPATPPAAPTENSSDNPPADGN